MKKILAESLDFTEKCKIFLKTIDTIQLLTIVIVLIVQTFFKTPAVTECNALTAWMSKSGLAQSLARPAREPVWAMGRRSKTLIHIYMKSFKSIRLGNG
uniref:Uncharacterized protein n=1 Tax=Romanomermis culicivorax TaxID=13658 RepID=A0A915L4K6_ROMCU